MTTSSCRRRGSPASASFLARSALAWWLSLLVALASAGLVGCEPGDRVPARSPKPAPCPPPPEPAQQAVVVGTIGKLHMVESRYPLSRLGDVLSAFKPDLVLLGVRVDAFRADHLEDASFEMTYAGYLARRHGAYVEPIDWFRDQDLGVAPTAVEPWDAAETARKETELLAQPRLLTFEQANARELLEKLLVATGAEARHRAGDPVGSRRRGWIQELTVSAVTRHDRPKRVLAFVDVVDRPVVDLALHGMGYATRSPSDVLAKSKDVMLGDVPADVLGAYRAQLGRAKERVEASKGGERAFWAERAQVLGVVVDKRAACCVPQSTLAAPTSPAKQP